MYHDAYQIYELLDKWNHQGPPNVDLMNRLFAEKPMESKRRFLYGQTLLHRAVESFPNRSDVVLAIFEAYPEALEVEDDNGFLVLHRLLFSANWYTSREIMDLVPKFVEHSPNTVVMPTPTGRFPLHLACQRTESEELVTFLINCFPDACQYRDADGKFPLDHALEITDPMASIVQLLVDQHPVLLSYQDDYGCVPLQRLLKKSGKSRRSRYDKVVEGLLQGFEGSLRLQDSDGNTPLMLACTSDSPLSLVYILLRQWPEQITRNRAPNIFDNESFNGELIHSSLASESSTLTTVRQWLQRYPDILICPDSHGRLPLHYAVTSASNEAYDIVQCLLVYSMSSFKTRQLDMSDEDGLLPIHIAAASPSCHHEILELLIQEYPHGLLTADKFGRLPWHYGECSRQDVVFEETARRFPDMEVNLDLVPDEIHFDFLSVNNTEL